MLLAGYARHSGATPLPNGHPSPASKPRRQQLPNLRIAAITNDTVATYASLAYSTAATSDTNRRRVVMGLVVGTGTNATVPMPLASLGPFKTKSVRLPRSSSSASAAKVVVNTEWSVTGTDAPLRRHRVPTPWDVALDAACECPGFQPVEYMTSGRYLGELVRLALVQLLPERCGGAAADVPPALTRRNAVSTRWLAEVVAAPGGNDEGLKASLDELFPPTSGSGFAWTSERMGLVRAVARAVQVRSAALVAAMIVGLLARVGEVQLDDDVGDEDDAARKKKVDGAPAGGAAAAVEEEEQLVVAHTGGVILQYPGYLEICEKWIDTLISKGSRRNASKRVVLGEAKDGGVIGAAVLAGMFTEVAL